jgi:long-chain-acyl-CoA dehydrogenase
MFDLYAGRRLFDEDHDALRSSLRTFLGREVQGNIQAWDEAEDIPRKVWTRAGEAGYLGLLITEPGAAATPDYRFRAVVLEELARIGATCLSAGFSVHSDIVLPYLQDLSTEAQSQRWIPKLLSGEHIGAIAMTEPEAGSDLRGIRTSARRDRDGWVLNGSKTFITNGMNADLVIVAARTGSENHPAHSLFVVESGTPGFSRGRRLKKVGLKAQDTAELVFQDVHVAQDNLLGEPGRGLHALMSHLPLERLSIAVGACAAARAALAWTIDYVRERTAFGKPIAQFQNTQFAIAEMVTELEVAQAYVDDAIQRHNGGTLSAVDAAKAKWWATEMQNRIVTRCLQLFGGYGYMLEYNIARAFVDSRVTTIYGGTTEIMKLIIARDVLDVR